jgi:PPOX class probable F420-dependent enzyme
MGAGGPGAVNPAAEGLSRGARAFLLASRVGRLATADRDGVPHIVPVCFALIEVNLYVTMDQKPKRPGELKRVRNVLENPAVAFIADRYDEDWSRLGWVMLRGTAEILRDGPEHDLAQARLRGRYPQYRTMALDALPVIAVRIARATEWGNLTLGPLTGEGR